MSYEMKSSYGKQKMVDTKKVCAPKTKHSYQSTESFEGIVTGYEGNHDRSHFADMKFGQAADEGELVPKPQFGKFKG